MESRRGFVRFRGELMVSVHPSVDPAGIPPARRSVSAVVAVASAIVLLTIGTACSSSSSSSLGAANPSGPEATPTLPGNLAAPVPSNPAASPSGPNNLEAPAPSEPESPSAAVPTIPTQNAAQWIELVVEGKEQLGPIGSSDGQAVSASCDPNTVSIPDTSHATASCQITYADGSVWQQTVTVTFDSQGNPVASADAGTEVSPPTGGPT